MAPGVVWDAANELRLAIILIQQFKPIPDYADLAEKFGEGVTKKALTHKIGQFKKRDVSDTTGASAPLKADKSHKRKASTGDDHEMTPAKNKKAKRVVGGTKKHLAPTAETEDEQGDKEQDDLEEMMREVINGQMDE